MVKIPSPANLEYLFGLVATYVNSFFTTINSLLNQHDDRLDDLESQELHCYVDLTTGNLMYEFVVPVQNQNENQSEQNGGGE